MLSHKFYSFPTDDVRDFGYQTEIVLTIGKVQKSMIFDCPPDEYKKGLDAYRQGALIQNAFPFLTVEEREFLLTGMHPDEQEEFTRQCEMMENDEDQ